MPSLLWMPIDRVRCLTCRQPELRGQTHVGLASGSAVRELWRQASCLTSLTSNVLNCKTERVIEMLHVTRRQRRCEAGTSSEMPVLQVYTMRSGEPWV